MFLNLTRQVARGRRQVNCCRFDVAVPHHLANGKDVCAAFEHQGGECVAQHVGAEIHPTRMAQLSDQAWNGLVTQRSIRFERHEEERALAVPAHVL